MTLSDVGLTSPPMAGSVLVDSEGEAYVVVAVEQVGNYWLIETDRGGTFVVKI